MKCEGRIRLSVVWFVIMEYIDILTSFTNYVHIARDFPSCFCNINQFIVVPQTWTLIFRFFGFFRVYFLDIFER